MKENLFFILSAIQPIIFQTNISSMNRSGIVFQPIFKVSSLVFMHPIPHIFDNQFISANQKSLQRFAIYLQGKIIIPKV